jgi:hypothetical protein
MLNHARRIHDDIRLFFLAFPAAGVALLALAMLRTLRARKFGASALRLRFYPARPGGDLAGMIHVARPITQKGPMELRLLCVNHITNFFSDRTSTYERVVWHEAQSLDSLPPSGNGTNIPVMFRLPPDAKPSDNSDMLSIILWRLEARCSAAGVNYFARFEIPVSIKTDIQPQPAAPPPARMKLTEPGIICQPLAAGGLQIQIAASHHRSKAVIPAIFGILLTGGAIGLALWPLPALMRIIIMPVAAFILFIGGVFDYIAAYKWLVNTQITARRGLLTVQRSVAMFHHETTYRAADLTELAAGIEGKLMVNNQTTYYYGFFIIQRGGKKTWLAGGMFHKDYADWLAQELQSTLGPLSA